jgi:hypothetical protein
MRFVFHNIITQPIKAEFEPTVPHPRLKAPKDTPEKPHTPLVSVGPTHIFTYGKGAGPTLKKTTENEKSSKHKFFFSSRLGQMGGATPRHTLCL